MAKYEIPTGKEKRLTDNVEHSDDRTKSAPAVKDVKSSRSKNVDGLWKTVPSNLRDNRERGSVAGFLRTEIHPQTTLRIATAYFTTSAFGVLRPQLETIGNGRLLFGEPSFLADMAIEQPISSFDLTETGLRPQERLTQRAEARACHDWIDDKLSVRSIRAAGLMHGKMVHAQGEGRAAAIMGSSNFTLSGLGEGAAPNLELNQIVDADRDRLDLQSWFDEIFDDEALTEDVKDEVLERLRARFVHLDPDFVYRKTLSHLFETEMGLDASDGFGLPRYLETAIWNLLYPFQRDGVGALLRKLDQFNGAILADSVGLGKTFTALAVIKWHEMRNQRVLVLCPRKLRENWTQYLAIQHGPHNPVEADRFSYVVLSHTDLDRDSGTVGDIDLGRFEWSNFDLVVIDESHAFRNAGGSRYEALVKRVLASGANSRVLMLSATPVNNDLKDLQAQLELVSLNKPEAFDDIGVSDLSRLIGRARRAFKEWGDRTKTEEERSRDKGGSVPRGSEGLLDFMPAGLTTLLDGVSIARSRRHVETHYSEDMVRIGAFPKRAKPEQRTPGIDLEGKFPSFAEIVTAIEGLNLALYNPFAFLREGRQATYETKVANFDQANRERFLVAMMKVGYLKRLESSVHSFATSMSRMVAKIDDGLSAIELERASGGATTGGKVLYSLADMDLDAWEAKLKQDRQVADHLANEARAVSRRRDAKLLDLGALVSAKLNQPSKNADGTPNRKVILFSAYSDTVEYIYAHLEPIVRQAGAHIAMVTGTQTATTLGRGRFQDILTNFAPRAKMRPPGTVDPTTGTEPEIDILVATDCISEGQNLQDADTVINVDIHWNPVRLIQRFGRIDRLHSPAKSVHMINYWPTDDLDIYLNLRERVEDRMVLVDMTATGDDNLFEDDSATDDDHWRDRQLRRLRDEVFDLEDDEGGLALTELTLEEFRADARATAAEGSLALLDAPLGVQAIVPCEMEMPWRSPGIILLLRQRGDGHADAPVNALHPHFLVWIGQDGRIVHSFNEPRSILAALRGACSGRTEPYEELCAAFDRETGDGEDMGAYAKLTDVAIDDIVGKHASKLAGGLTQERAGGAKGMHIPKLSEQPRRDEQFELVTWFIIKDGTA